MTDLTDRAREVLNDAAAPLWIKNVVRQLLAERERLLDEAGTAHREAQEFAGKWADLLADHKRLRAVLQEWLHAGDAITRGEDDAIAAFRYERAEQAARAALEPPT